MKTWMPKASDVNPKWWVVDAKNKIVGRLASEIAMVLMGKHRPTYAPHIDMGDYVVVLNADKVVFTGNKWKQKQYTWTTYYPGLRSESAESRFAREPESILVEAVRRMLPKNKLSYKRLAKLKVYCGDQHPHQAQNPEPKELGAN